MVLKGHGSGGFPKRAVLFFLPRVPVVPSEVQFSAKHLLLSLSPSILYCGCSHNKNGESKLPVIMRQQID